MQVWGSAALFGLAAPNKFEKLPPSGNVLACRSLVHPAGNKHVKHKICAEQITKYSVGGQRSRFKYGFRFLPIQSCFFLLYTVDLILQLYLVVSLCCSLLGIPSHLAITPMAIPEGNQMF